MIYTVGLADSYDKYIKDDSSPMKGKGGSAWRTREEAEKYLEDLGWGSYKAYGLVCDWEDTKPIENYPLGPHKDCTYRKITKDVRLIQL